jgi:hypothetical protein
MTFTVKMSRFSGITAEDIPIEHNRRLRSERDDARREAAKLRKQIYKLKKDFELKEQDLNARADRLRMLVLKLRRVVRPPAYGETTRPIYLRR